jgi:hypothetical protein
LWLSSLTGTEFCIAIELWRFWTMIQPSGKLSAGAW